MRIPLIGADGLVVNVIEYDPELSVGYTPPDGLTMHDEHPDAVIGAIFDRETGAFTLPESEPVEAVPSETEMLREQIAVLTALLDPETVEAAVTEGRITSDQAATIGVDIAPVKTEPIVKGTRG